MHLLLVAFHLPFLIRFVLRFLQRADLVTGARAPKPPGSRTAFWFRALQIHQRAWNPEGLVDPYPYASRSQVRGPTTGT